MISYSASAVPAYDTRAVFTGCYRGILQHALLFQGCRNGGSRPLLSRAASYLGNFPLAFSSDPLFRGFSRFCWVIDRHSMTRVPPSSISAGACNACHPFLELSRATDVTMDFLVFRPIIVAVSPLCIFSWIMLRALT